MTSDGYMIASHTSYALYEPGSPSDTNPFHCRTISA